MSVVMVIMYSIIDVNKNSVEYLIFDVEARGIIVYIINILHCFSNFVKIFILMYLVALIIIMYCLTKINKLKKELKNNEQKNS